MDSDGKTNATKNLKYYYQLTIKKMVAFFNRRFNKRYRGNILCQ